MNKSNYTQCLVLDTSYMARQIISTERAFVINYKGNAEIIQNHPVYFGTVDKNIAYPKPSIIRIFKFIKMDYQKVPLTRRNIYKRDNYTCVYCQNSLSSSNLTLDHVVPQSKGGKDAWDNLVTCCKQCNSEKADLSIEEWGRDNPDPRRPHFLMLIKNVKHLPDEWKPYLFF